MRSSLVLLALCVIAGAGGISWLANATDTPPPLAPASATATDATAEPDAPAVAAEAAGADVERVDADPEVASDMPLEDAENDRIEALPDQQRAPRVQVVRGEPPVPVADAEVLFVTEADATRRLGAKRRTLSRAEWPEVVGQRVLTGKDGIAQLPVTDAAWLCAARAGGEFAFRTVPPRDRVFPMALVADEQVVLAAQHADERPAAGVPLAIAQQVGGNEARLVWRGEAAADGRAVVKHFQLVRDPQQARPDERFAALPLVPGATAVEFPGRPAAADAVPLVLPALGSVRIQLVDHRGKPVLSPAAVGIAAAAPPALAAGSLLKLPRGILNQRVDKPAGPDPVLLPFHQVGAELRAYARYRTDRRPAEVGPLAGPTKPDEVVDVTLPLAPTHALLAGRLMTAEDRPWSGTIGAALWRADRDVVATDVESIADGHFDVVLAERTDAREFWLALQHVERSRDSAEGPWFVERLSARVHVPPITRGSRIELGDIVLGEQPALVGGLVMDDAGQPVADADVQVQQQSPPREGQDPEQAWRALPLLRTRTEGDGTFVIVAATLPPGQLRVRADTGRHFADAVPLHSMGQQVRITITRNGMLRGRVLLPDWIADNAVSLQLQPFDEALRKSHTRSVDLARRSGGRFTVEPLHPGRYDARVLLRNVPEPLAVVPDVFVPPGEAQDPRFRPLDLRNSVFRYRLRAVDAAGQPFAVEGPILARFHKLDGTAAEAGFRWQKGRAELITGGTMLDVVCFGRGHRTARLQLSPGDHDVMLPALRPALVELPGLRALCGPTRRVRISAILQGDTGLPAALSGVDQRTGEQFGFARWDLGRTSGGWLGHHDTVEIPLMTSGKYQLLLRPHATDSERSPQGSVALGVFDLEADGISYEPVRVPVDATAVLQALQQLDQRHAQALQQEQARQNQPRR